MLPVFANQTLVRIGVYAVAVLGLNIVMGYTGQVSLGQIFFVGLGAYVTAYGVNADWNITIVFVLAMLIPGVVGLVVALAAARLGGLAIAMVTIALPIVGLPLAKRLSEFTGGSQGDVRAVLGAPEWSGLDNDQWQYYIVLAITVVAFLLARNLVRGKFGRAIAIVRTTRPSRPRWASRPTATRCSPSRSRRSSGASAASCTWSRCSTRRPRR